MRCTVQAAAGHFELCEVFVISLSDFFEEHSRVAIAFSGGVDSAYLLYAALQCGSRVRAYYVKSAFQPQFELDDARRLADELHADMKVIHIDLLSIPEIVSNSRDRCYYCKKGMFTAIKQEARKEGFPVMIDGTIASDDESDRPGMPALRELFVRSPLRECGLTKADIRRLSREAGLFTWDKPAYACLATRIPTGESITRAKLEATEKGEQYLFALGFTDFRIRMMGDGARIQLPEKQFGLLLEHRSGIVEELKKHYRSIMLDLETRS